MKKERVVRICIIIFSCLLVVNLALLAGIWLNARFDTRSETVVLEDNIITPEEETSGDGAGQVSETVRGGNRQQAKKQEPTISLYRNHAEDVVPFQVDNMFPGDTVEKDYVVEVSYQGSVTVHFHTSVRIGDELLADALECRIQLTNSGQVLYDGPVENMPESVTCVLNSDTVSTNRLHYIITVYLDTSADNRYQNQTLIADFRWWVDDGDKDNLKPAVTGDQSLLFVWLAVTLLAICMLILLLKKLRKEDYQHEE